MSRCLAFLARCVVAFAWLSIDALASARADPPRRPCATDDPEFVRAEHELTAIDEALEKLDIAGDPTPLVARIQTLAKSRCLEMNDGLVLKPTSGLSLKTYWAEGGSDHLRSYLDLAKPGQHLLWFAPSVRRAFTLETNPTSLLWELLCPYADASCGLETRGWAVRAQHDFEISSASASSRRSVVEQRTKGELVDCEEIVRRVARKDRFAKFRDCEEQRRTAHAALPIGRMRALDHGWLILEGRRGHHSFCDETRAYHLATGSAYRVASCGGLALQNDGQVDFRATDARRKPALQMGHLPVMALREAVWMLLLMDRVDPDVVDGYGIYLPSALPLSLGDEDFLSLAGSTAHFTSADTKLTWHVETRAGTIGAGTLTWSPQPLDSAAGEHAVTLVRVAEASWVDDCPEAAPPTSVFRAPALSASGLDADSASLAAAAKGVFDNWREIAQRQRACAQAQASKRVSPPAHSSAAQR